MSSRSRHAPLECVCSGRRWCAGCLDEATRARRNMDRPQAPPPLLARYATPAATDDEPLVEDGRDIHRFDVASGEAPTMREFAGVHLVPDFLAPEEADALLQEIDRAPFVPSQSGRQKQHYGARVNFNRRRINVDRFPGLPRYTHDLVARALGRLAEREDGLLADASAAFVATDVFVLRYAPERRSNLDLHLDDLFAYGELILDLSLESDSVMTFYRGRPGGEVDHGSEIPAEACVRVPIPAGSMMAIYGPARFQWEHGLLARDIRARRTSITLRTLSPALLETEAGQRLLAAGQRDAPTADPMR